LATILCVDDDPAILTLLRKTLERMGHAVEGVEGVPEALQYLANSPVDLVVSDFNMPGATGIDLVELMRQQGDETPLIMLTGHASIEHAVAAVKAGAIDYVAKPFRPQQLELAVTAGLEVSRLRRENASLRREVTALRGSRKLLGESLALRRVLETAAMAAPTRAAVLLQGESGTGKELVAQAIHEWSDRRDRPFIHVNCAAMPEGLIESALFGHEKGAFTGAIRRVEGAFERADKGTILLDEISEMRLDLQAKLLRVLQEQEFERVGGSLAIKVDVRIIATTNRDLAAYSAAGHFRLDLYYRLGVIPVRLPPLRERKDDIAVLAYRFASHYAQEIGKEISGISPEALELLQQYDWPGNVRELQHAVERAVILTVEPLIPAHAFDGQRFGLSGAWSGPTPARIGTDFTATHDSSSNGNGTATLAVPEGAVVLTSLNVNEAEAKLIERALEVSKGNRTRAAELLGISVRTLRNKLNGVKLDADGGGGE
jgi:DNA-binding NtrC family response regulator